jgi:hypothetical protein
MRIILLIFAVLAVFFSVYLVSQQIRILPKAAGTNANILVDTTVDQGQITPIWQALAQGGEELFPFDAVQAEVTDLKPKYIRIDHLYDFYNVVDQQGNQLIFDWTRLDKVVKQILGMGALPFLSLSYMPPAIAQNNDIVAAPAIWENWSEVVENTIEHFSGRSNLNLNNVIYEVWNEPDLFGNWRIGGKKDYLLLYKYAIDGATRAENVNVFKIGGPAITAPYKNWVDKFLKYIFDNNLRLDFYSWHKYSLNPADFLIDVNKIDTWLFQNAGYTLPKYITEFGSVSDKSTYHDTIFDAAHLVATTRQLLQRVDLEFTFEIKDGPSAKGEKYQGGWGVLTHESAGSVEKKPKYLALMFLSRMVGNRLSLEGEGTWVTGFASKNGNNLTIILANFDQESKHSENFPLVIKNLENGSYLYQETYLSGSSKNIQEEVINQSLNKGIFLTPNNVVLIELIKT